MPNAEISDLKLTSAHMNECFIELINNLVSKPSLVGVTTVVGLAEKAPKRGPLTPSTMTYCWKTAIKTAAKLKSLPVSEKSPFNFVLDHILESEDIVNPAKTLLWQRAAADICETAFIEVCNPNCLMDNEKSPLSPLGIVKRSTAFLKQAWEKHCFIGQIEHYYRLVDKLMTKVTPTAKDIISLNSNITSLISLAIPEPPQKSILPSQMMSKWIRLLAASNQSIAASTLKKAIEDRIYENYPEELDNINIFLKG